ncbi:hypothetical protein RRG08_043217 [Elysia crispata]|uniref:Uncharacterized protein n=1 Tax=Elysia crispata TaxID=231223 RepID=A0AAE0ZII5_9GAST|nr:hypothetical protein RRG08_043217 [Elysia crispata]
MTEKKVEELTVLVNKLSEKIDAINIQIGTPPSASVPESHHSSAHSQPAGVISAGGVTTAVALDSGTERHSEVVSHQILRISPLDEKPTIIN